MLTVMFYADGLSWGKGGNGILSCGSSELGNVFRLNTREFRCGAFRMRNGESVSGEFGKRAQGFIQDLQSLIAGVCDSGDNFEILDSVHGVRTYGR